MENDDFLNFMQKLSNSKPQKSFSEYLIKVRRRKWILITSILCSLAIAAIYNKVAQPKYAAYVILKKEVENSSKQKDQFNNIVSIQNGDKIDTEMKIVKTNEVLEKVINELKLFLLVSRIQPPLKNPKEINESYLNYLQNFIVNNPDSAKFPRFINASISTNNKGGQFYLLKENGNRISLYDEYSNRLIQRSECKDTAYFISNNYDFTVVWSNAKVGSKVFFTIDKYSSVLNNLAGRVMLEQEETTNLFKISVTGDSPYEAQIIANTLAEKFKNTRIDQLKKSIRYSFNFVDQQLTEVTEKLKKAENNIKEFKSSNKIVAMNESSTQTVELLSKLEVEKVNVDLELTEYNNKLRGIEDEYRSKKFFDQTYLTPNRSTDSYTPFSSLLLKLSDLEIQKIEALNRKKENHPDVVKLDEQIREIKSNLEGYNQNTITAYQIMVNSLKEKQNKLNKLIMNYGFELAKLPANETKLAKMLREKNVYEKVFTMLLDKREELRMAELSKLQDIEIIEQAQKPLYAATPRVTFNFVLALLIGFVTGIIIIGILEIKNNKKLGLEVLESEYNIPIFAIIPTYSKEIRNRINKSKSFEDRFVTLMDNKDGYKETYRLLISKISFFCDKKVRTIMFSSCEENTGKTSVVANLGLLLVQSNKNVLLIDCDLKRARLTNVFGLSKNTPGLINAILEKKNVPMIYNLYNSKANGSITKLHLIPSGGVKENSNVLIETEEFKKLIETLSSYSYDYILIDTPPVTRVVDSLSLAKVIKDTIMIVRPDYTLNDSFKWGVKELKQAGATIHSVVVNACDIQNSAFRNSYGYGYDYSYNYNDEKFVNGNSVSTNNSKLKTTNA